MLTLENERLVWDYRLQTKTIHKYIEVWYGRCGRSLYYADGTFTL